MWTLFLRGVLLCLGGTDEYEDLAHNFLWHKDVVEFLTELYCVLTEL